jgi:hypothetical protein
MQAVFSLGRRAIEFAVLFLAIYAFAVVPIGRRTGLEHLRAILRTPAARNAGRELERAATRLGRRVLGEPEPLAPRGKPELPSIPRHAPGNAMATTQTLEAPDASL